MSNVLTNTPLKALLKIGYYCNYSCNFCHAEEKKNIKQIPLPSIFFKVLLLKKKWVETILLSWWESSLEKHFFTVVAFILKQWLSFWIVTNGSTIVSESFLNKLDSLWIQNIYLSLHWYWDIHNKIVWDDKSFDKINTILSHMNKRRHIKFFLNYVVTKENYNSISDTVQFLSSSEYPDIHIKFSILEPSWAGDNENLFISPREVSEVLKTCFSLYNNMNLFWDWFPPCLFQWFETKQADLQTENIRYITELYESKIFNTDYGVRSFHKNCDDCSLRKNCYWVFSRYIEFFPSTELILPIKSHDS